MMYKVGKMDFWCLTGCVGASFRRAGPSRARQSYTRVKRTLLGLLVVNLLL